MSGEFDIGPPCLDLLQVVPLPIVGLDTFVAPVAVFAGSLVYVVVLG